MFGYTPSSGAVGKSAYELAVDNGFVGTLDAWLLTLKGDQGDPGVQGDDGDGVTTDQANSIANENKFAPVYITDNLTFVASNVRVLSGSNIGKKVINTVENSDDVIAVLDNSLEIGDTLIFDNDGTGVVKMIPDTDVIFLGDGLDEILNAVQLPSFTRIVALKKKDNTYRIDGYFLPVVAFVNLSPSASNSNDELNVGSASAFANDNTTDLMPVGSAAGQLLLNTCLQSVQSDSTNGFGASNVLRISKNNSLTSAHSGTFYIPTDNDTQYKVFVLTRTSGTGAMRTGFGEVVETNVVSSQSHTVWQLSEYVVTSTTLGYIRFYLQPDRGGLDAYAWVDVLISIKEL
tara:strand:+ start:32262 stop:33299 length:1038 start_codon:yes stop_codon:yes gene_type:complete